jgi:hypothetical protein
VLLIGTAKILAAQSILLICPRHSETVWPCHQALIQFEVDRPMFDQRCLLFTLYDMHEVNREDCGRIRASFNFRERRGMR